MDAEKKEFGLWWLWVLLLVAISIGVMAMMGYFGKYTGTIIERKVFEESYQRSEGLKSQLMTWEAQLASINSQLVSNPNDVNLKSQKAMLEVQINQTKGMK